MYNRKFTSNNIEELLPNQIFVFGSNTQGLHQGGAAKLALERFRAVNGIAVGFQGQSYAIPTLDWQIASKEKINVIILAKYIDQFIQYATFLKDSEFLVTEIGCGIAGFTTEQIAPLFKNAIDIANIILPESFVKILNKPKKLKVYKMTNENMICNPNNIPFQYELNKIYTTDKNPIICKEGFHSCSSAQNCLNYYSNNGTNRLFLCEVELNGTESFENHETIDNFTKIATNNIIFLKELTNLSKEFNTGNWNTGDMNTGDMNTGDMNTGDWNTGNRNTGDMNTGNWNTGDMNTGNWNAGNRNTGDMNTGDWNTGNRNTGDLNTTNAPWRCFNTEQTTNKSNHYFPNWLYFSIIVFKYESEMTDQEKIQYPYYKTTGMCLIKKDYKQAAQESYNKATKVEQDAIEKLPSYDAQILFDLFGIDRRRK